MSLTRRDAAKLVLAGPALALSPLPAVGQSPQQWAQRLQDDLDTHLLPGCDGTLRLVAFDARGNKRRIQMAAIIQLDWPPGMRRRRFDAAGEKGDAVYNALLNQALFSFAKAWPGCVV